MLLKGLNVGVGIKLNIGKVGLLGIIKRFANKNY
jgi:hypothetical protein